MNFILVHFKTEYEQPKVIEYYKDLEAMHELMLVQLTSLYPKCTIHVITNEHKENTANVVYHYRETNTNYAKLHMFSLLDEPAMYVDCDIILLRPWEEKHLQAEGAFTLYQPFDVGLPKGFPEQYEFMYQYQHYNSGMIWIPRPDKAMSELLTQMTSRFPVHEGGWVADEYPINYFIYAMGWKMNLFPDVNAYRKSTKIPLAECQSLHYAGCKELFWDEYRLLKRNKSDPLV